MRKPAPPSPRPSLLPTLFIPVGLGIAALLAYANSFTGRFALDNKIILLQDPRLTALSREHLRQIFQEGYWWPNITSELYRPLTTLSYLFNYSVLGNGPQPAGYHVVNFLLHWANAILLFTLVRRIAGSIRLGAIAAALFAVHPIAVESVTNIVGRADLLAAFCVLLGAHFYLRATGPRSAGWLCALAVTSVLGVLCKENGVMIVFLILLYDLIFHWPALEGNFSAKLERFWRDFVLRRYWAMGPALLVFAYTRHHFTVASAIPWQYFVDNPIARATPLQGFLTAMKVQGEYLALLFWPAHLTCDYSYNHVPLYGEGSAGQDAVAWLSLGVVLALLVLAWHFRRKNRPFTFGVLLYAGLMLPTANLLVIIGSVMAERFLYLPAIGFVLAAAVAFDRLGQWLEKFSGRSEWKKAAYAGPVVLAVLALAVRTYLRNEDWRNELALWTSAVHVAPDSFKTHKNLAESIRNADSTEHGLDAAIAEAEKSLAILNRPDIDSHIERRDNTLFPELALYYAEKARACRKRGDNAEAVRYDEKAVAVYRRAVAVDQWVDQESHRVRLARGIDPAAIHPAGQHEIYRNFALVLIDLGRYDEALNQALACSRLAPFEASPWHIAGGCLRLLNRPAEAAPYEIMAVIIKPDYVTAWQDLYQIYTQPDPAQNPIQLGPDEQFRWNLNAPRLRQDLATGCTAYVRLLREDNYLEDAKAFEQFAISHYSCPATTFDRLPPPGEK